MLGYVTAYKPEMKVKEAEIYKAYYCGICKSIGKRYGQLPRMTLSYDAAFLAVLLSSIADEKEALTREACIANPFKKKAIVHGRAINYSADVMLMLAYLKLKDDAHDEKKLSARFLAWQNKGKYRRIARTRSSLASKTEENLKHLNLLEAQRSAHLDEVSDVFARIMQGILTDGLEAVYEAKGSEEASSNSKKTFEAQKKILSRVGYNLGKWIYLTDAYDDIEDNIKNGAYNPLLYRFSYDKNEDIAVFKARIKNDVERNLILCLSEIAKSLDLLDIKKNKGIIENIIYVGLLKKTEEVLEIQIAEKRRSRW